MRSRSNLILPLLIQSWLIEHQNTDPYIILKLDKLKKTNKLKHAKWLLIYSILYIRKAGLQVYVGKTLTVYTGVDDLQAQVNDVEVVGGGGQRSLQLISLFPIFSRKTT